MSQSPLCFLRPHVEQNDGIKQPSQCSSEVLPSLLHNGGLRNEASTSRESQRHDRQRRDDDPGGVLARVGHGAFEAEAVLPQIGMSCLPHLELLVDRKKLFERGLLGVLTDLDGVRDRVRLRVGQIMYGESRSTTPGCHSPLESSRPQVHSRPALSSSKKRITPAGPAIFLMVLACISWK